MQSSRKFDFGTQCCHSVTLMHHHVNHIANKKGSLMRNCCYMHCHSLQLHWLACSGRVGLITSFLDHGASPDAAVRIFQIHSTVCSSTIVRMLLCLILFTQDAQGQTPIHFACQNGHVPVCWGGIVHIHVNTPTHNVCTYVNGTITKCTRLLSLLCMHATVAEIGFSGCVEKCCSIAEVDSSIAYACTHIITTDWCLWASCNTIDSVLTIHTCRLSTCC